MIQLRRGALPLVAALAVLAVPQAGNSRSDVRSSAAAEATDVLLAFDTTGSMAPSIAAAQHDAETIVSAVGGFAPNSRFAVASFRDRYYPGGSYTLVTSMTPSKAAVSTAIGKLKAVGTLDASKDTPAEAYNLLFHKSYTDGRIGWRAGARKIVIVIGDAEPHSAGADGLAGCVDKTHDWDGLTTTHELAGMRAAKRTLIMIRQAQTATTSLACYSTLASLAYEGGSARNGGTTDIASPVLALVKQAFAPFSITPQLARAIAGRTNGLTVRLANPNSFPIQISGLSLGLPGGVSYVPGSATGTLPKPTVQGGSLTWQLAAPLLPFHVVTGHIVLRFHNATAARLTSRVTATAPDGRPIGLQATALVRLVRQARKVTVAASGNRGAVSIQGTLTSALSSGHKAPGSGSLVLRSSGGKAVTVRSVSARATAVGAPTSLALRVVVTRSSGFPACLKGAGGTLRVVDSDALARNLGTRDSLALILPAGCGGAQRFTDAASAVRLSIKLGFS